MEKELTKNELLICEGLSQLTKENYKDITEMLETIKKTGGLIKKHKRD